MCSHWLRMPRCFQCPQLIGFIFQPHSSSHSNLYMYAAVDSNRGGGRSNRGGLAPTDSRRDDSRHRSRSPLDRTSNRDNSRKQDALSSSRKTGNTKSVLLLCTSNAEAYYSLLVRRIFLQKQLI